MERGAGVTAEELAVYRAAKSAPRIAQAAPESPAVQIPALPAPDAAQSIPATANGIPAAGGNTWAKGRNGNWLVRGKPGQSGEVTVTKKSGQTSQETIKRVIWQDNGVALYEV